ncbi:hypothetical protein CMEL01_01963 [Colletotrichum melonis]|uniref:Uncharacterized protein n=1 Tax=Colletotrichum melonis TaxID=1209925 RepID=A0AAI9XSW6_9PEZI|nr:hypothetical protein CMEL01_01963 [Colletotrichum melonis]
MSFRNVIPIVVAVVAGISISTHHSQPFDIRGDTPGPTRKSLTIAANYTLKPELERQAKLRDQKQFELPKPVSSSEPNTSDLQTPNQTKPQAGTGPENSRPKS